jgi:FkbM family methyltransferase
MYCAVQIRRGRFASGEPEWALLDGWVRSGGLVLDIGANVGTYTLRMSQLVGPAGRVFAFEPVMETFEILAANVQRAPYANVTLLNVAVSDKNGASEVIVPTAEKGFAAHYFAHLASDEEGGTGRPVYCLSIDSLDLPERVSLVKIDVEGHEKQALAGMRELLRRDLPTLIVEGDSLEVEEELKEFGYFKQEIKGSHNRIYTSSATVPNLRTIP